MNSTRVNCSVMARDPKPLPANEQQAHEYLHTFLTLLQHDFPTTKDFDCVFKPNMFVKNNQAGFHHVIYYLLKIYHGKNIKKKITQWPIHDSKTEAQFRREVMACIAEIKSLHPDANMPSVMTSHLISPGGHRFVNLMLKIAQIVVTQVLQKEQTDDKFMMKNIKVKPALNKSSEFSNINNVAVEHLKKITKAIENETVTLMKDNRCKLDNYELQAFGTNKNLTETKKNIIYLKEKLKLLLQNLQTDNIIENPDKEIDKLENDLQLLVEQEVKFSKCSNLITYLNDDCYLNGNSVNQEKISLLEHFSQVNQALSMKIYDVQRISTEMIDSKLIIMPKLLNSYENLKERCPIIAEKMKSFMLDLDIYNDKLDGTMQDSQRTPVVSMMNENYLL